MSQHRTASSSASLAAATLAQDFNRSFLSTDSRPNARSTAPPSSRAPLSQQERMRVTASIYGAASSVRRPRTPPPVSASASASAAGRSRPATPEGPLRQPQRQPSPSAAHPQSRPQRQTPLLVRPLPLPSPASAASPLLPRPRPRLPTVAVAATAPATAAGAAGGPGVLFAMPSPQPQSLASESTPAESGISSSARSSDVALVSLPSDAHEICFRRSPSLSDSRESPRASPPAESFFQDEDDPFPTADQPPGSPPPPVARRAEQSGDAERLSRQLSDVLDLMDDTENLSQQANLLFIDAERKQGMQQFMQDSLALQQQREQLREQLDISPRRPSPTHNHHNHNHHHQQQLVQQQLVQQQQMRTPNRGGLRGSAERGQMRNQMLDRSPEDSQQLSQSQSQSQMAMLKSGDSLSTSRAAGLAALLSHSIPAASGAFVRASRQAAPGVNSPVRTYDEPYPAAFPLLQPQQQPQPQLGPTQPARQLASAADVVSSPGSSRSSSSSRSRSGSRSLSPASTVAGAAVGVAGEAIQGELGRAWSLEPRGAIRGVLRETGRRAERVQVQRRRAEEQLEQVTRRVAAMDENEEVANALRRAVHCLEAEELRVQALTEDVERRTREADRRKADQLRVLADLRLRLDMVQRQLTSSPAEDQDEDELRFCLPLHASASRLAFSLSSPSHASSSLRSPQPAAIRRSLQNLQEEPQVLHLQPCQLQTLQPDHLPASLAQEAASFDVTCIEHVVSPPNSPPPFACLEIPEEIPEASASASSPASLSHGSGSLSVPEQLPLLLEADEESEAEAEADDEASIEEAIAEEQREKPKTLDERVQATLETLKWQFPDGATPELAAFLGERGTLEADLVLEAVDTLQRKAEVANATWSRRHGPGTQRPVPRRADVSWASVERQLQVLLDESDAAISKQPAAELMEKISMRMLGLDLQCRSVLADSEHYDRIKTQLLDTLTTDIVSDLLAQAVQ